MRDEQQQGPLPPVRAAKTLRDEYAMAVIPALLCQKPNWTAQELARRTLDIANAILATRAEDKKAFLRLKHEEEAEREYEGDDRGNS